MYVFIVNPISGNGRTITIWKNIERLLVDKGITYDVKYTNGQGHATEIVRELDSSNVTAVIAVGGDGTVHDVVNGLKVVKVPLGIIPAGSGNDYARSMNIPKDFKLALERILTGKKKKIDILHVGERCCMTVIGIGFDGRVAELANSSKYKKILNGLNLGKFTYLAIVLKVLFQYKPTKVTITLDDEDITFDDVWLVAVANLPYYGGGMNICPDAESDDGILDVCIVHSITKLNLLKVFPKVFKGKHVSHQSITILRGKKIKVISDTPVVIHGDGEIIGQTPIEVIIVKDVLDIV
ncbi:diacylglycerol/lipid kinase family protein [Bacillus sp. FJAT-45350]|uniref:diacylglycerol/lipid kinase family protein n=1 Tax=Bacillus sp. FJAT-45350 TaxID=2011014 RepID=UPI000BB8E474|nr:diacylglycerol kinase family protein [Bacillus sp. FJAT-45350]